MNQKTNKNLFWLLLGKNDATFAIPLKNNYLSFTHQKGTIPLESLKTLARIFDPTQPSTRAL